MHKSHRIFIVTLFVLLFSSLSLIAVNGQTVSKYLFLEVIDSDGKSVPEAAVEVSINSFHRVATTNSEGEARFPSLPRDRRNLAASEFKVTKPGYFPFQDFGSLGYEHGRRRYRLELLKSPQTKAEREALGTEQLKREFMWAARDGDAGKVRQLIKAGISPNLKTNDLCGISEPQNIPAILFAAVSGNGETVKTFLKAGVNVQTKEEPLHSILIYYLQANPFSRDNPKTGAEKVKLMRSYEDGVRSLINAEADIHALGEWNQTALIIAVRKGYLKIAEMLLDRGVNIDAPDRFGGTALMSAISVNQGAEAPQLEMFKRLLKAGADPNFIFDTREYCRTALMDAAAQGSVKFIKALIEAKADVNPACRNDETALTHAVRYKQVEAVKVLIESGADVKGKQGRLALKTARELAEKNRSYVYGVKKQKTDGELFQEIVELLEAVGAK